MRTIRTRHLTSKTTQPVQLNIFELPEIYRNSGTKLKFENENDRLFLHFSKDARTESSSGSAG